MLCLKYSVFKASTVYFTFRDVGTWELFAENISVCSYAWYNTEAEDRTSTSLLSKSRCTLFPFITTGKYMHEGKKWEVMEGNGMINPCCLWKCMWPPGFTEIRKFLVIIWGQILVEMLRTHFTYLHWEIMIIKALPLRLDSQHICCQWLILRAFKLISPGSVSISPSCSPSILHPVSRATFKTAAPFCLHVLYWLFPVASRRDKNVWSLGWNQFSSIYIYDFSDHILGAWKNM